MSCDLVARILERGGALVERTDGGLVAVLPEALSHDLGLEEETVTLGEDGDGDGVPCGFGSAFLETVLDRTISRGAVAFCQVDANVPRSVSCESALAGLNVSLRFGACQPAQGWILLAHFQADATAHDRDEQRLCAGVTLHERTPFPPEALERVHLETTASRPSAQEMALAAGSLGCEATRRAVGAAAPLRGRVAWRTRRDMLRVDGYFLDMDRDLARRMRSSSSKGGLGHKRALLPAERDRRLQNLWENDVVRVRLRPLAFVLVRSLVGVVTVQVRRRQATRDVAVHYHPLLGAWQRLSCESCARPTAAIGACNQTMHLLCAECLAGGPGNCPACRRQVLTAGPLRLDPVRVAKDAPGFARDSPLSNLVPVESAPPERRAPEPLHAAPASAVRDELERRVVETMKAGAFPFLSTDLQSILEVGAPELRKVLDRLIAGGSVVKTGRARGTLYSWVGAPD